MDADRDTAVIEPVHWGARLAVAADARYTEVGDVPVAVVASTAEVVRLTGEMAALAMRLDGRPLRDALAGELEYRDDADRRRVIDVVRRLKALGVLVDVPADGRPEGVDWAETPELADAVTVAGQLGRTEAGTDADGEQTGELLVGWGGADDGAESSHDAAYGAGVVTIERSGTRKGEFVVNRGDAAGGSVEVAIGSFVLPVDGRAPEHVLGGSGGADRTAGVLDVFVALVGATRPRARLADPGVVDLLSDLTEQLPASWGRPDGA